MIRLTWVHFVSETKCFIKIFEFFASQTIGDFLIPVKCFSPIVCNVLHACCLFRFHCLISIIAISLAIIISAVHLSRLIFTGSNRWTLVVTGRFADTSQNYNLRFRSGRSGVPIQIIELGSELRYFSLNGPVEPSPKSESYELKKVSFFCEIFWVSLKNDKKFLAKESWGRKFRDNCDFLTFETRILNFLKC